MMKKPTRAECLEWIRESEDRARRYKAWSDDCRSRDDWDGAASWAQHALAAIREACELRAYEEKL